VMRTGLVSRRVVMTRPCSYINMVLRLHIFYVLIYVDDIVLTASSTNLLRRIIFSLHKEFDMTDLGALNYFLGISVTRDSIGMFMSQKKHDLELLHRAHMANCNSTRTQIDRESKLGSDRDPIFDPALYRSLGGGLQYLTFLVQISLMQCNRFAFICMVLESLI
ncbi:ribonuclease H-like domain-containing protein, partial [Tanacetum coccineum]